MFSIKHTSFFEFVKDFVKQTTDLDYTEYFAFNCSLAYLIVNIDLHFHNMGVQVLEMQMKKCRSVFSL